MALRQLGAALALLCLLNGAATTRELHGERVAHRRGGIAAAAATLVRAAAAAAGLQRRG